MTVVGRILKLVPTTIDEALKRRPRNTRQSLQSFFGDLRMLVTFPSLNGSSIATPNHIAAAQYTANGAWPKNWPSCGPLKHDKIWTRG